MAYFPGVGTFEQPYGSGRGNLNTNCPKIQMPRGFHGGGGEDTKASIWLVHNTKEYENNIMLSLWIKLFHYLG